MKRSLIGLLVLACLALPLRAEPISKDVYKLMHLETKDVLTGPILTSRVLPGMAGDPKQVVALVTYMTGKREEANAVNVRLEVMRKDGEGGLSQSHRLSLSDRVQLFKEWVYAAMPSALSNRPRPSMPPCAASIKSSGCGMRPSTLPSLLKTPAMSRSDPLGFAPGA